MEDEDNQRIPLNTFLVKKYEERIMGLLNDQQKDLYLREHYAESPNYYGNQEEENMIQTLIWLSYSDQEKKDILDKELEDYTS